MATERAKSDDQALLDELKTLKGLFTLSLLANGSPRETSFVRSLLTQSAISRIVPIPTTKRRSKD
jgi:hypothetical protein